MEGCSPSAGRRDDMTKRSEPLPRPAAELERLAGYYDIHDTSAEMEPGDWVEPQPMATTSLRLPVDVIEELKRQARARHLRYTSYVRSILERAARGETPPEIADITERLERIERAVTERQSSGDQKTALRSDRPPKAVAGWTRWRRCCASRLDPAEGRMDLGLDGRVYLVTGGSRGLGFAAAQALVADGARVVLSAPHEGRAWVIPISRRSSAGYVGRGAPVHPRPRLGTP